MQDCLPQNIATSRRWLWRRQRRTGLGAHDLASAAAEHAERTRAAGRLSDRGLANGRSAGWSKRPSPTPAALPGSRPARAATQVFLARARTSCRPWTFAGAGRARMLALQECCGAQHSVADHATNAHAVVLPRRPRASAPRRNPNGSETMPKRTRIRRLTL